MTDKQKIKNLEKFMIAVADFTNCLPDFNDYLPDKGNAHIIRKLNELKKGV